MGIRGLTTFIDQRSDIYLKYYELHDTFLVIDGNSISCQIYAQSNFNCAFGGDYDNYAQCVSDFFDDLSKCKVIPLVIFDGGHDQTKLNTIISRKRDQMRTALSFSVRFQQYRKFFPLLLCTVFRDVLKKKNIKCVQCIGEADNHIAAVAKILNCPVLSYDSDFFIHGSLYIPFNTLDNCVVKSSTGEGYMKCCKIYKDEYLLDSYKGLTQSMLPLAAILLSNDYVHWGTFKNFFCHLSVKGISRKNKNVQQCHIDATLTWLSKYTLNNAIIAILSKVAKPSRKQLLDLIETNINNYLNISTEMLIPLGFSEDYVECSNAHCMNKRFIFDGDINKLTYIEEVKNVEEECDIQIPNTFLQSESMSNEIISNLPEWFKDEYCMSRLPPYFMDIILYNLYIMHVQVEDYNHPSSHRVSLKIISLIFGIIKSGQINNSHVLRCMIRGENNKPVWNELEGTDSLLVNKCTYQIPSLFELREISLNTRKWILDSTLLITNTNCIDELPPKWMLYVGCIKYWIDQQHTYTLHKSYLYAMFVCLLSNIIDSKIGKHRQQKKFNKKYGCKIESINQERKENGYNPQFKNNVNILEAYKQIDYNDCLLAAPFFISHFQIDFKLHLEPKKFNRTVVHAFAEFQSCVHEIMCLNALLGCPYQQIVIAELYNGTLLYNLSNKFKIHSDIEKYITSVLQKSLSLLRFFNIFLSKVKPMFASMLQNQYKPKKQRQKLKTESVI